MKTYEITINSWGGTKRDYMTDLTYKQARQICEDMNWQFDAGYIWDLEIEEYDKRNAE